MNFKRLSQASIPALLGLAMALPASAQFGDGNQTMAMGSGRMVRGTVTAATADHLTVKTEAGDTYDVVVTPNTTVRKGRDPMKFADIHTGDAVGAVGEMDAAKKTVHALMVTVIDAAQVQKARDAMGKTMISGTVTAIDDLKITIKRTDDVTQTIMVDEDTSFRKGGRAMGMALAADGAGGRGGAQAAPAGGDNTESLTLADVKVGSVVAGPGTMKNGFFVPTQLAISDAGAQQQQQQQRRRRPDGAATPGAAATTTPAAATPPTTGTEPK